MKSCLPGVGVREGDETERMRVPSQTEIMCTRICCGSVCVKETRLKRNKVGSKKERKKERRQVQSEVMSTRNWCARRR